MSLPPELLAQIYWRCRRGMLELDAILIPFYQKHFSQLSVAQQQAFIELLDERDQNLYTWLLGYEACTQDNLKEIVTIIRQLNGLS